MLSGDLIYTRLLGKDVLIINSEEIAKELLENRSRNYSDRPYLATKDLQVFFSTLHHSPYRITCFNCRCGRGFSSIFMEYGDRWRLHRRFFHQTFRREAVCRFTPLQHRKACQLLRKLLDSPDQFPDHIFEYDFHSNCLETVLMKLHHRYTGSVILSSVYDYDAKSRKDELFGVIRETLKVTVHAMRPDVSILVGACPARE